MKTVKTCAHSLAVLGILSIAVGPQTAMAQTTPPMETTPASNTPAEKLPDVVVTERSNNLVGVADSATQGTVGAKQLQERPILRPGELLETVPGVIITQHSGSGKANQYYLRGFNLDHGTDLAISVDGMPVNMRTHAHGQGYSDINFLIPETISGITYRKGSYSAEQGDFSAAGSVDISLASQMQKGIGELSVGNYGHRRAVFTATPQVGKGNLLYGLELFHYDGPWVRGDDYRKANGVLRYTQGTDANKFSVTAMGYDGKWNSTDQVPDRAIDDGSISRFGNIDPTDGGSSHRYSLSTSMQRQTQNSEMQANAYVIDYKLHLFSDFTYFLDDPVNGDQFEQADQRHIYGGAASYRKFSTWSGHDVENRYGLQGRYDDIGTVGLYHTKAQQILSTTRQDKVKEGSFAPYFENRVQWSPVFRTVAGVRYDIYHFDVDSNLAANSGTVNSSIVSPKLSAIFGPYGQNEYYASIGQGFHSNDARGTTITEDPTTQLTHDSDGNPIEKVTPLVRANEAELGVRSAAVKNLQSTFSLWYLKFDSELLFTGDAGTTEPSRPSRRTGVEFTNFYTPTKALTLDADFAYSWARFTDSDPVGNHIPGSVEGVISTGVAYDPDKGAFASLRLRYFGPRPLIEDNSVRSKSSTLVNARVGYKMRDRSRIAIEVFNLFDSNVSDVDYYYTSRLPGEPAAGVNDIHTHPAESRSVRLTYSWDL